VADDDREALEHARRIVSLLARDEVIGVLARDEHPRYALYKALIQCVTESAPLHSWSPGSVPLHLERELLALILSDPDETMARATVLDLIDWNADSIATAEDYERWFESVRPDVAHIPFVVARGEAWTVFKRVMDGDDVPVRSSTATSNGNWRTARPRTRCWRFSRSMAARPPHATTRARGGATGTERRRRCETSATRRARAAASRPSWGDADLGG